MQPVPLYRALMAAVLFAVAITIELWLMQPMFTVSFGDHHAMLLKVVIGSIAATVAVGFACGILLRRTYYGIMAGLVFGAPYLGITIIRLFFGHWASTGSLG